MSNAATIQPDSFSLLRPSLALKRQISWLLAQLREQHDLLPESDTAGRSAFQSRIEVARAAYANRGGELLRKMREDLVLELGGDLSAWLLIDENIPSPPSLPRDSFGPDSLKSQVAWLLVQLRELQDEFTEGSEGWGRYQERIEEVRWAWFDADVVRIREMREEVVVELGGEVADWIAGDEEA